MGSLQSARSVELLKELGVDQPDFSTFILIKGQQIYTKSTAALLVTKQLSWPWPLLYAFIVVPAFIRNAIYSWIAKNRYNWFGKQETCWLPSPEYKDRFID